MKTCERGEALLELADNFALTIKELVNEVKYLKERIELLENPNHTTVNTRKQMPNVKCGMAQK
jgi:hypothetical protein